VRGDGESAAGRPAPGLREGRRIARVDGDRRKVLVVLAPDAVDRLAPIYAGQGAMLQRLLTRRTPAELEVIRRFLEDLATQDERG